jgi:hypothetical protein
MTADLGYFFSLIGKAKKEKEDEFRTLVGELDIDSMFSQVKESVKEEKKKKEKQEKQVKALEAWLFSDPKKKQEIAENVVEEIEVLEDIVQEIEHEDLSLDDSVDVTEEVEEDDTIDHALKILETIKSKEEVRENVSDPEIVKIRRELEYLKNLVNAQGGGGEVRLEYLDDLDRNTAKVDGKFLQYQSSTGKWIGTDTSSGGSGDHASVAGIATYSITAGIATYSITAGIATYSLISGISTYSETSGISTYSPLSGISTYSLVAGISTYSETSGIATYSSISGLSTYSETAGLSTASQGLVNTPNIIVGFITASSAEFSGNITIGGTLTYEDVTNIDSVGLITARSGIRIIDGGIIVNSGVSTLGIITSSNIFSVGVITATTFDGNLSYNNLTGVTTSIIGDSSPTLGGNLDINQNYITGTGGIDISGIATATGFGLSNGLISSVSAITTSTSEVSIDSFNSTIYRSAKYQIQVTKGSEYQITEIYIVHDDTSSYGTEYATIKTGSTLSTFSTDISSGNVRLLATPFYTTSTAFKLVRTLVEI